MATKWELSNIDRNTYKLSLKNSFIILKVNHNFSKDVEINIANTDMSRDNIIFMKELYPIPQENIVVIGTAYRYDYFVCIEDSLVDVEIIDSNIDNPKSIVESFWL